MSSLDTFFRIEVLASTVVVVALLMAALSKKDLIISDTGLQRLNRRWTTVKTVFFLGLLPAVLYMGLLSTEMIESAREVTLRSAYPVVTEWLKASLVFSLLAMNLITLRLVLEITGGGK